MTFSKSFEYSANGFRTSVLLIIDPPSWRIDAISRTSDLLSGQPRWTNYYWPPTDATVAVFSEAHQQALSWLIDRNTAFLVGVGSGIFPAFNDLQSFKLLRDLSMSIDGMNANVMALQGTVSTMSSNIATLVESMASVGDTLKRVSSCNRSLVALFNGMTDIMSRMRTTLNAVSASTATSHSDMTAMISAAQNILPSLATLHTDHSAIIAGLAILHTDQAATLTTLHTDLRAANTGLATLHTDQGIIQHDDTDSQTKLNNILITMQSVNRNLTTMNVTMTAIKTLLTPSSGKDK